MIEEVDILLVRTGTTPGLRRDDAELLRALRALGMRVAEASTDYGLLGHLRVAYPMINLVEGAALRYATKRALKRTRARAIVFSTAGSAILQPASFLRRGAVRFDSSVERNRPGWRNTATRWLGRRAMSRAAILLPWSAQAVDNPADPRVQILPTPISPGPKPAAQREPAGLCYAVNPDKKGLDIAVAAWAEAAPPTWPLYITGIEADTGLRFLRRRSLTPGENVVWLGRLTPDEHRKLSARVELCLGAARTDEYAAQQLEALVDGAIIVSVPSGGTIASVALARELNPALVATEVSAPGLAVCISRAIKMSELERTDYRARARVLMESHSRANFEHALAERVLPALLG